MRRIVAACAVLAAAAAGAFALTGAGGTSGGARVDAIFDNASFLIPGQDVKIAGARVGKVSGVVLTPDHKARIEMEIDPAFTPFHADADCTIQPQSLIGEKFVQCTPGTPRAPALRAEGGHAPTVPIANTHSPVDLDLVFATFRQPVNTRLGILLNELGTGLAARGSDLNDAIRRANPALQETNRVLKIVSDDRRNLQELLTASDHVLATLAQRRERIGDFITSARKVSETTAERSRRLGDTVQGLPPLLRQAKPSLKALQTLAEQGTPLLRDLRSAAPQLRRLADDAAPLTAAARPALTRLGTASVAGDKALKAAAPVVKVVKDFAASARPTGELVQQLLQSIKETGTVEGLQDFTYYAALATSRFDKIGHILPAYVIGNQCGFYATTTSPDCDAHFHSGGAKARARPRRAHRAPKDDAAKAPAATTTPAGPPPAQTTPEQAAPAPAQPSEPQGTTIQIPGLPPIELPPLLGGGHDGGQAGRSDGKGSGNAVQGLLDYLLK